VRVCALCATHAPAAAVATHGRAAAACVMACGGPGTHARAHAHLTRRGSLTGNLTMKLLERAKKVIAIELDPRMVRRVMCV
jgi:hypothetical protein